MALDGAFIHCLREELAEQLAGTRVDKVFEPSHEEIILQMHGPNGNRKVYFSARAASPRVNLTRQSPENPAVPPRFCMLLRKRLTGGRLLAVRQNGLERALYFDFDCLNELGDPVQLTLAAEMMGRHSNVILVGPDGRIIDCLRRVDFTMSSVRPVLPGMPYEVPPAEPDRLDLTAVTAADFCAAALAHTGLPTDKALLQVAHGLSPLVCREIAFRALRGQEVLCGELSSDQRDRLRFFVDTVRQAILTGEGRKPYLLAEKGTPREFSFWPILQYGLSVVGREEESLSALLDTFYAEKDAAERQRQNAHDILRVLSTAAERVTRKLEKQREELRRGEQREQKRLFADLLMAQIGTVPAGADHAELINYYDENCASLRVPLDPALSAAANAQKYYKEYRKAVTAAEVLQQQIVLGQEELVYLDSVFDALSRAQTARELTAIREELIDGGYLRAVKGRQKPPPPAAPMRFLSDDGYEILVGRNNVQNDQLTLKTAAGSDWWFHIKNFPGSHVIVLADGAVPPDATLTQAAVLAATFSRAGEGRAAVEVDYTRVRHVRKPAGARPGMVIYDSNRTAVVTPDPELADRLRQG